MKQAAAKHKKLLIIVGGLLFVCLVYLIAMPIDRHVYATSGCVPLGESTLEKQRYSVIKGEGSKYYKDKKNIDPQQVEFLQAGCDISSKTHSLHLF